MSIQSEAERRALRGFIEAFPGVAKPDKNNPAHVRFMVQQIRAHEHLLEQNMRRKSFGTDIRARKSIR